MRWYDCDHDCTQLDEHGMGENSPGQEGSHGAQFYNPIIITEIPNANLQIHIQIQIDGVVLNLARADWEKPSWTGGFRRQTIL